MSDNFKKTVNLKDRMKEAEERQRPALKQVNKAEQIDKLYEQENSEFKKFSRPKIVSSNSNPYKGVAFILLVIVVGLFYYSFFQKENNASGNKVAIEEKWMRVELVNGEVFYGLVGDVSSDPFMIKSVYYNYDQEKDATQNETGNLRLVKRGKETYGPDGYLNIVRNQVSKFETLREDSKVLQAILANEGE